MKPVSPVFQGRDLPEVVFAKDQPQYLQLPAYVDSDGDVVTRWKLTWRERLRVALLGEVYLSIMTFNHPLQPVRLEVKPPELVETKI